MKHTELMVDLETYATSPRALVLSVELSGEEATMKHTELMVDLETYATSPRALVLSVGAVAFSFHDDGLARAARYRAVVDHDEQLRLGREVDAGTLAWWAKQAVEARAVLDEPRLALAQVLGGLHLFVQEHTVGELALRPWGNGADFDLVILSSLFQDCGMQRPWRYHQQRCFRTLKNLFPPEYGRAVQRVGANTTKHDCLADALWQAEVAYEMWEAGCLWGRE